jgi:hypothetical protein
MTAPAVQAPASHPSATCNPFATLRVRSSFKRHDGYVRPADVPARLVLVGGPMDGSEVMGPGDVSEVDVTMADGTRHRYRRPPEDPEAGLSPDDASVLRYSGRF